MRTWPAASPSRQSMAFAATATPVRARVPGRSVQPRRARARVTCSVQQSRSREARLELWREVAALRSGLDVAVSAERYADAARLRDEIEEMCLSDEWYRVSRELEGAVRGEEYAKAARLKRVLDALDPPPSPAALRGEVEDLDVVRWAELGPEDVPSWSETTTDGVTVRVESHYIAGQSVPEQGRFLFGYKVRITNNTDAAFQLVSRHWTIESAGSSPSDVRGPGVIGKQPVLVPGETFEYTSACPITVALSAGQQVVGRMGGTYDLCKGDTGDIKFQAKIGNFYFALPFRSHGGVW